ncbi:MAG: hypothetical protein EOP84_18925 [Verrucomicrobiaceae bacterium]|nr:MAG: hypothetical protein EOP84_18925 [Verrucomicrobiaceae bacterium]
MSPRRNHFPRDLHLLIFQPVLMLVMMVALSSILFPLINGIRHPSPSGWLIAFYIATSAALLGTGLLFFAKLPQYRAGSFWRLGFRHLPALHQRLYRLAFLLIVPSCLALLLLLMLGARVR